jgi:hypothetical protein
VPLASFLQWSSKALRAASFCAAWIFERVHNRMMHDPGLLNSEEYDSLVEVSKGDDAQGDIPQLHWERLVSLGYALRRLGVLTLTEAGKRRLAARNGQS